MAPSVKNNDFHNISIGLWSPEWLRTEIYFWPAALPWTDQTPQVFWKKLSQCVLNQNGCFAHTSMHTFQYMHPVDYEHICSKLPENLRCVPTLRSFKLRLESIRLPLPFIILNLKQPVLFFHAFNYPVWLNVSLLLSYHFNIVYFISFYIFPFTLPCMPIWSCPFFIFCEALWTVLLKGTTQTNVHFYFYFFNVNSGSRGFLQRSWGQ